MAIHHGLDTYKVMSLNYVSSKQEASGPIKSYQTSFKGGGVNENLMSHFEFRDYILLRHNILNCKSKDIANEAQVFSGMMEDT